tara:strand:- start:1 stop:372 length:372 start_codon:yes stop_codon:yes gene_type:complete
MSPTFAAGMMLGALTLGIIILVVRGILIWVEAQADHRAEVWLRADLSKGLDARSAEIAKIDKEVSSKRLGSHQTWTVDALDKHDPEWAKSLRISCQRILDAHTKEMASFQDRLKAVEKVATDV